jgi:DNA gyrase subunit A
MDLNNIAKDDFLNYAMAVIKHRAIPNVEDNLKPVHRRILYTMYENKLFSNKRFVKSARTTGNVMGQYHPHGDTAIYDALVRLSQHWKMRYPLIEMQGNNGSITGASAAAQRYTEAKLSPIGDLMVEELKYKPVDYEETYDGEGSEPRLLPSMFPNVLCNGNMGIAVGMSSSIVPHNLKEVVSALKAYMKNPDLTVDQLIEIIPGPDLPTGGIINNIEKIKEIYKTGRGTLEVQAKYHIEEKGKKTHIVITEIPYLMNVENNITEKIKELANEELSDVYNIENNIGRNGIEYRIILKPKANTGKVLQILFNKTGLKNNLRIGLTVLKNDNPIVANMLDLLDNYLRHRHNIITNIAKAKKEKADTRLHIVEGLLIALQDIDGVIKIVKKSSSKGAARQELKSSYKLSEEQAEAILNMRISQLNKIDAHKLHNEQETLMSDTKEYKETIESESKRNSIINEQLNEIVKKFGDSRRTELKSTTSINTDIAEEYFVAALFDNNEIEIKNKKNLRFHKKNRVGDKLFDKDPKQVISVSNKELILMFSDEAKSYLAKDFSVDEGRYLASGIDQRVSSDISYITKVNKKELDKDYLVIVTNQGTIKKSSVSDYNSFKSPIKAIKLRDGDSIIYAGFHNNDEDVIVTSEDKILRFSLKDFSSTGRNTIGVKSMDIDNVVDAAVVPSSGLLLMYNEEGRAKITAVDNFSLLKRASKGQKLADNLSNIEHLNNTNVIVLGKGGKYIRIEKSELSNKSSKALGTKLYPKEIAKICV